jgi:hypothetical protein
MPARFYSVLNAIVTIPLLYMIKLDGFGFTRFGTHGLLWMDAAGNLLVFAVVIVVFVACGVGLRRVPLQWHKGRDGVKQESTNDAEIEPFGG